MSENKRWYKLDNAAKIIPSSAHGADTRVFLITCELKEDVDPGLLQQALDEIVPEFPLFGCALKRGIFWYYLEDCDLHPVVTEDALPACAPLYTPGHVNLLYRVSYYHRRINLEMFHVLADGTGAFVFLKKLVSRYLTLAHDLPETDDQQEKSSVEEKSGDAFDQYYEKARSMKQLGKMATTKAYQIQAETDENLRPHLIEGTISASKFLAAAHDNNTTVGVLAVSVYMAAVIDCMSVRQKKRPICVSVPVNLRQYFKSDTTRNFFGVIPISYDPSKYDGTLGSIVPVVAEEFKKQLSEEQILRTMNSYAGLEHNYAVKMVPLWIKDLVIDLFNRKVKQGVTSTMSNLGQIKMPESMAPYIQKFSAFMAAPSQQVCVSSFGDQMVFGEVSPYTTHEVMLNFFRRLSAMGIEVELATNDYDVLPETASEKKTEAKEAVLEAAPAAAVKMEAPARKASYCPKCHIQIRDHKTSCPLCQGKLGEKELEKGPVAEQFGSAVFPVVRPPKVTSMFLVRIMTFLMVSVLICCSLADFMTNHTVSWLGIVAVGSIVAWADFLLTLYLRHNILKAITVQVMVAIVIDVLVDYWTGWHAWSVMWMIPISLVGLGGIVCLVAFIEKLRPIEYIMYLLLIAMVAAMQLIPIKMHVNPFEWPAIISLGVFLIVNAGILIFRSHDFRTALDRRLNL